MVRVVVSVVRPKYQPLTHHPPPTTKPNIDDILLEESGDVAAVSYPALSKTVGR